MGFQHGSWLHEGPDRDFGPDGRRAIVRHLCFGPAESRVWYAFRDGRYVCQHAIAEGLQAGECFTDPVPREDLLRVLEREIALCQIHRQPELAARFRAEKERLTGFPPPKREELF